MWVSVCECGYQFALSNCRFHLLSASGSLEDALVLFVLSSLLLFPIKKRPPLTSPPPLPALPRPPTPNPPTPPFPRHLSSSALRPAGKLIASLSVLKQGLEVVSQCRIAPTHGAQSPRKIPARRVRPRRTQGLCERTSLTPSLHHSLPAGRLKSSPALFLALNSDLHVSHFTLPLFGKLRPQHFRPCFFDGM